MTLIKICGITNLEDARAAIEAGADMLGFNFYRPSPRFIEPQNAYEISSALRKEHTDRSVAMVGVFVNEPSPEAVVEIMEAIGLDAVQLHGDEPNQFSKRLKALLPGKLLIKAVRVNDSFEAAEVENYESDAIMLDAFHPELRGGTGRVIDWSIARRAREFVPRLFLSGGLSPENVAQAIAEVQPFGVDACSSLESSPGHKDADCMKAFVRAVRSS
jgi:phosphoribosylanthranilate isomerase